MQSATEQLEQSTSETRDSSIDQAESKSALDNLREFKSSETSSAETAQEKTPEDVEAAPASKKPEKAPEAQETTPAQVAEDKKTELTPSQLREARIKELKQEMKALREKAKKADEFEKKLVIHEAEKLEKERQKITEENFYESASTEGVPDVQYYNDLVHYYVDKVDSEDLDKAIEPCTNKHGVLYCLLEAIDKNPGSLEEFKKLSPIRLKQIMRDTDRKITEAKAQRAQSQGAPPATAKTSPPKAVPKAVVAETSDSTSPNQKRDIKGLKPNDALRHFKTFGASGVFD